jgi:nitrite reductase/ring-hydroxylating ferredoxin subunit
LRPVTPSSRSNSFVAVYRASSAIDDRTRRGGGFRGQIEDHQVICPRHGARFCLRPAAH